MKSEKTIRNMIRDLATLINRPCGDVAKECAMCQQNKSACHIARQALEWALDENMDCDQRAEGIHEAAAQARMEGTP
jgi:hypothetical protein